MIESAALPDFDPEALIERARHEIDQIGELIDDVLFLSELETGRTVVSLGTTVALPHARDALDTLRDQAERAGVSLSATGDEQARLPLRPRMLRVVRASSRASGVRSSCETAAVNPARSSS